MIRVIVHETTVHIFITDDLWGAGRQQTEYSHPDIPLHGNALQVALGDPD